MRKNHFILLILMITALVLAGCGEQTAPEKPVIGTSIVPLSAMVESIAGDTVDIVVAVPTGSSPTNYQPSPRELTALSEANHYFSVGTPADLASTIDRLTDLNADLMVHRLDELVETTYPARYFEEGEHAHEDEEEHGEEEHGEEDEHAHENEEAHEEETHDHGQKDPHIWLSPKRAMLMVDEITRVLSEVAPEHADQYAENAASFKEELASIDERIRDRLKSVENKTFIMYHPSLGYFADDYGLEMLAIEAGGKEATVNHLKTVIDFALEHDIRVIFYQDEITSKQAETLAESIDGETVAVSPLSGDYLANLEKIAATLEEHLR